MAKPSRDAASDLAARQPVTRSRVEAIDVEEDLQAIAWIASQPQPAEDGTGAYTAWLQRKYPR